MTARSGAIWLALTGLLAAPLAAQDSQDPAVEVASSTWTEDMVPVDPFAARAPFGPGEHLVYRVKIGVLPAGYSYMSVLGTEDVRDNPSYRVEMGIHGGLGPLKVDDTYESWFDVSTFQSWTYTRDVSQPGYQAQRHYEFYPDEMRWDLVSHGETGPLGSALPLDEISFIYFIRTMELEVGKSYTINRYFKDEGNPVVIEVLRRDTREVDGVVYNTIVVNPLITTSNLFGEGGNAEVHLTDDERRIMVYLKSNIPKFPGSLTMHLQTIQDGFPLHPESRAEAMAARLERAVEASPGR